MNKEMKTLNGYEVVDAKAREDIEVLKQSGGGSSSDGSAIYLIEGQHTSNLTDKDKEMLLLIYDCIYTNKKPPEDYIFYANYTGHYYLVDNIRMQTASSEFYSIRLHLSCGTDNENVYYVLTVNINTREITNYARTAEQKASGGLEFDEHTDSSYDFTAYNYYSSDYVGDSGYDSSKVIAMVALILVDGKRHHVILTPTNFYNSLSGQVACIYNSNTHILYLEYSSGYLGYEVRNSSSESLSFTFEGYSFIKNK